MKKLILLFSFLSAFIFSHSQVVQKNNTWWEYKLLLTDTFSVPGDTVSLPSTLKANRSFLAAKDTVLYIWSISLQKYIPVGNGGTTALNATWGNILGTLSSQTDLQTALDAKALKTTTLTINGTTQDLSANRSWGPFLVPGDTTWIHSQIIALQGSVGGGGTGGTGVTFQQALVNGKVITQNNDVTGAFRMGFGTSGSRLAQFDAYANVNIIDAAISNTIQAQSGTNFFTSNSLILEGTSEFIFSGIAQTTQTDSSLWKPVVMDASGHVRQGYWFGGGGGGATPTLQDVTDAGNTTTNEIKTTTQFTASDGADEVYIYGNLGRGEIDMKTAGNGWNYIIGQNAQTATTNLYFPNTGNSSDTIATKYDLRSSGGGSSTVSDSLATHGSPRVVKVYRAIISQSGTSDPTVVELENTLGAITWTRSATGYYIGTLTGAFSATTTWLMMNKTENTSSEGQAKLVYSNSDTVSIFTYNISGSLADGNLVNNAVEIRVYY